MNAATNRFLAIALCAATATSVVLACHALPFGSAAQEAPAAVSRRIGVVKAINGTVITLTPDSGPALSITVQPATRIVRIAPGEKNLKNATPIQLQDIQVGDRILVGANYDDNASLLASSVVVMKRSDLEAKHQEDLQDWQKRGVDGLAKAVDPAAGTVTISARGKDVVFTPLQQP